MGGVARIPPKPDSFAPSTSGAVTTVKDLQALQTPLRPPSTPMMGHPFSPTGKKKGLKTAGTPTILPYAASNY